MLKIKDNVDLKELEKFDFVYKETLDEKLYKYYINTSESIEINANKKSDFYKDINLHIEDEYYDCYTSEDTFDIIYDLIQAGLVEKC